MKPIPTETFRDPRGEFAEIFDDRDFPSIKFVEDDVSNNLRGSLKGIHGDDRTWKLVCCLRGTINLVVVDRDKKWEMFKLDGFRKERFLIPPGFGLGYETLSEKSMVLYKQSSHYGQTKQFTIPWNSLGIPWKTKRPILSERDRNAR